MPVIVKSKSVISVEPTCRKVTISSIIEFGMGIVNTNKRNGNDAVLNDLNPKFRMKAPIRKRTADTAVIDVILF